MTILQQKRKELRLTRKEMGLRLSVSEHTITSWEHLKRGIKMKDLKKVIEGYELNIKELLLYLEQAEHIER